MDDKTELKRDVPDDKKKPDKDEQKPKIIFNCSSCSMNEKCEYKGKEPYFARNINFIEDCYVMIDPFSPPAGHQQNKTSVEQFLILGADCALCGKVVCKSLECSFFYGKTFCMNCAKENLREFPIEIQSKIRRQLELCS